MQDNKPNYQLESGGDVLREFQLAPLTISEKCSKEYGLKVSRKIWGYCMSNLGGYFYNRNVRYTKNRNFANGRIDVQAMFQDRFQFVSGKENYIRLVWNTLQIVNRIVSGLVGRWMQRGEKIIVEAIDTLSQTKKMKEYEQIEFIVKQRKQIEQLQQSSGVQLMPNQDIPQDQDGLLLWQRFQRTPEEIMQELDCNDVLATNGWFGVLKELGLHDSVEVGFIGTYTYMDEQGVIHTPRVKPEDAIYSATDYPDFRDCTWMGQAPSLKISELRRKYGKEFNPNNPLALTEEQLFSIAQTAKEYKTYTNLVWDVTWNTMYLRPYDEWNVRSMEFELRTVDSEPYTVTVSKTTGTTYTQKGMPVNSNGNKKQKPSDNQTVLEDTNVNIYRGVYLPDNNILLEWGLKKNMIRPQDPVQIGNAEFSYSYYMYQPYQMRNLAVPEKIEAAVDGMILALLKMQQVVARMRPTGAAIDESALQNIDYGLGEVGNQGVDYKKLYDQTGDIYYRGVDAEGNRVPIPIQELQNSGFLAQMDGLIRNYQFWYQTLKDELGTDPNLITAAVQPRVTADNVQVSQQQEELATDYMYRAYLECMKMTAKKISCLVKDSVMYGGNIYRSINNEEFPQMVFSTDIKMLPTEQEVLRFENTLMQTLASSPDAVMFFNQFQLIEIAKEDVKLAWLTYNQAQKKMKQWQMQTAQQNAELNAKQQQDSLVMSAQMELQNLKAKLSIEAEADKEKNKNELKKIALQGMFQVMASKESEVQPEWQPVVQEMIQNIMLPLLKDNLGYTNDLGNAVQQQQTNQSQPMPQAAA